MSGIPSNLGIVRLRPVEAADLPIFFEHQRDPVASRMAAFPPRDRAAFDAHWAKLLADAGDTIRTVLFDGRVAGNVLLFPLLGRPSVGYWIGREYWGRGVATRALSAFVGQIAVRPLYARVVRTNPASVRVLEKCGFVVCGEDRMPARDGMEAVEEFIFRLGPEEVVS